MFPIKASGVDTLSTVASEMASNSSFNIKPTQEPSMLPLVCQGSNRFLMLTDESSPWLRAETSDTADKTDTANDMFNRMVGFATSGPPFTLTFKVMMSSYDRVNTFISVEGNRRMMAMLQDIHECPYRHSTYHTYMYRAHMVSKSFISAVGAAADKAPGTSSSVSNCSGDVKQPTQDDFDVCLTMEIDQTLQHQTRIETGPRCSKNMILILNKGRCYNMEDIWYAMKNVVCRVLLSTYLPLCGLDGMGRDMSKMMEGASVEGASSEGAGVDVGQPVAATDEGSGVDVGHPACNK